ncbi:MAG: helix-turn-helix transcriptional regulator [Gemmatimonadetes bacterium]|nr:helix-turn-helix transcriptional regulator [Gemmatimonadota bacterium]
MQLRPIELHVLLSLLKEPMHGYGIVKDIRDRQEGRMSLEPGNLYRVLRRLLDAGLIERAEHSAERPADDDRRRYYGATAQGRAAVQEEMSRMRALLGHAEARLAGGRGSDA